MQFFKHLLTAATLAATASGANAALLAIHIDANTLAPYAIKANNDLAGFAGTVGEVGASVVAGSSTRIELVFELLFSEAGRVNTFSYGGEQLFQTVQYGQRDYTAGKYYTAPVTRVWDASQGQLMDFSFGTLSDNPAFLAKNPPVTNANNGESLTRSFFTSLNVEGNALYLAFDDAGAGPDDDHDDMIIRVTARDVSEVPVPAAAWLFGSALVPLAMRIRRRG